MARPVRTASSPRAALRASRPGGSGRPRPPPPARRGGARGRSTRYRCPRGRAGLRRPRSRPRPPPPVRIPRRPRPSPPGNPPRPRTACASSDTAPPPARAAGATASRAKTSGSMIRSGVDRKWRYTTDPPLSGSFSAAAGTLRRAPALEGRGLPRPVAQPVERARAQPGGGRARSGAGTSATTTGGGAPAAGAPAAATTTPGTAGGLDGTGGAGGGW